jgi:hypothetical protein
MLIEDIYADFPANGVALRVPAEVSWGNAQAVELVCPG